LKTCVILNPVSGSVEDVDALVEKFRGLPSCEVHVTADAGAAEKIARQSSATGCELVVAAGGDGTLNEVINGIADHASHCRIGLVPLGTGNDFARSLALPDDVDACIELLLGGRTQPIDLVRVTSDRVRYFLNVSAGGFSGLVDEKLTPEIKRAWGPLAYVRSAAAALPELVAYQTTVVFDDAQTLSMELYNIIVANGRFVAGGIPIAPEAQLDDGLLDLILIPKRPGTEIAILIGQILLGKHLESEAIVFRRAARLRVDSTPGMWFNVDGELVGNEPASFEVMPRAVQIVTAQK
jgi:diacylglycerol kinase (ATP)